ncbi:phenylacetaldehyde reductase-like [Diospyros lotus]|uniref:phenylacetaldehyde reductase-like n=1 Tax=Diospyros lotus TaxID=55363 RepID=UPI00224E9379|nr:phenylacetaldehyde reductase-like [Diospyros lotus]
MSRGGEGKVVCVTGASGFIASWLVKLLLDRGYTVNGTVRSLDDPKRTEHLLSLEGARERLNLFEANLIEDGSFDLAIDGCVGVFHTASPVFLSSSNPQEELIDPAVKGTLNVLRSCVKVPSIKRVVITSSIVSVFINRIPLDPSVIIDETWYSDQEFCKEFQHWYPLAKILAEEAGWKFAKENGIDLVTLHPGWVIGPVLQPTLNYSTEVILNVVKDGTEAIPNIYRCVDVRDVAYAHILAFENPSASGRYCLVEKVAHRSEVMKIIHKLYPTLNLPKRIEDEKPDRAPYQVSKQRAESLGLKFTPLEVTVKDTVESFKEKNLLSF